MWSNQKAQISKDAQPNYFASNRKISSQGERMKLKVCIYLVYHLYYMRAQLHPNQTISGWKGKPGKCGQTKKHKFQKMLILLCFQSQNLESRRA